MRRLAVFAYSFSAAAFLLVFLRPGMAFLLAAGALLLAFGLCSILLRGKRRGLRFLRCVLPGLALACVSFALWNQLILRPAEKLVGEERQVEATVLDYPLPAAYGESLTVRIGRVKCRLYLDDASGLEPGQRIAFDARIRLTEERTGEDYHLTTGLPLFAYGKGSARLLGKAERQWLYFPAKLGKRLRDHIEAAFDEATSPFLTAILTGERSGIKADGFFYSMMREAGVLHCIAVSGMHLSFLVSFLAVILGRGKHSSLICIPVILLFMAVTGFTPSVVRAGIMQLAVCGAVLLDRDYDNHSALALALAVLTAFNPFASHNVGLLLSFFSTLGILLFYEKLRKSLFPVPKAWEKKLPGKVVGYLRSSLAVSLSALVLTLPITAVCFGQIPLLGPLANLLILWAVTLCFGFALISALLGFLWMPAAVIVGWPARWLVKYIRLVVTAVGRLPFASLYPQNEMIALWLVCLYLLMAAFRFLPGIEHRLRGFSLAAAVTLAFSCVAGVVLYRQDTLDTAVLDVGQGQCMVLTGRDFTLVADCGSTSATEDPGDTAARYLLSRGRMKVDALVLTHYHADHMDGAEELMRRMPVGMLLAPPPDSEEARSLLIFAEERGTEVCIVSEELRQLRFGELQAVIVPPLGNVGDNEECLCALFSVEDYEVLMTGDASGATELRLLERLPMPDIELIIAGHHGSAKSSSKALLDAAAPDVAVISAGRNSYGLPSEEALARLSAAGAAIYRTDRAGTVEIRYRAQKGAADHE